MNQILDLLLNHLTWVLLLTIAVLPYFHLIKIHKYWGDGLHSYDFDRWFFYRFLSDDIVYFRLIPEGHLVKKPKIARKFITTDRISMLHKFLWHIETNSSALARKMIMNEVNYLTAINRKAQDFPPPNTR
jgi:hypothetical protein